MIKTPTHKPYKPRSGYPETLLDKGYRGCTPTFTFNPIEKIIELYNEKMELYERMLQAEKEKNELLQKLMDKK